MRVSIIIAALLLIGVPASADTGVCSGGTADPFYSVTFAPLTLHSESNTFQSYAFESLQINFNQITIKERQVVSGLPPPVPPPCRSESVPLYNFPPPLPPGSYNVTWEYYAHTGPVPPTALSTGARPAVVAETPLATFHFAFTIPPSAIPALDPRAIAALFVVLAAAGALMLRR